MSGLARLLAGLGARCTGSDQTCSDVTDALARDGLDVSFDQDAGRLPDDCSLVVASAAIDDDHPELLTARRRGVAILSYAEALGRVQAARTGISIAGTHGKSTTAAMLCHVLIDCGLDPGFIIGARCGQIGGGHRVGAATVPGAGPLAGRPGILVAEACEFNRSFRHHRPRLALINNIEADHLDVYGSLDRIIEAFADFARLLPDAGDGGRLLIAHDGAHRHEITKAAACAVTTFGLSADADCVVSIDPEGCGVAISIAGAVVARWRNVMPGAHNALNAAAAAILASMLGVGWEDAARALGTFAGLDRRMQRLGERPVEGGSVIVYDDYGHHPTEIERTLEALRAAERPGRLVCVFQPHQHSRTRFLLDQFARSFAHADLVIVARIYFVRDAESELHRIGATDLVDRLRKRGVAATHVDPFEAIVEHLRVICRPGDLLVIMGAGPVWQVARQFMQAEAAC